MKVNSFTAITPGGAAVSNQVGSSFVNLDLLDFDLDFDGIFDTKNKINFVNSKVNMKIKCLYTNLRVKNNKNDERMRSKCWGEMF